MRRIPSILFVSALVLAGCLVAVCGDDSEGARGDPKTVYFIDGNELYEVLFITSGMDFPDSTPSHHGQRFVGWAYDGRIVSSSFNVSSLSSDTVYLYAVYEDDPMGGFVENMIFYGALIFVAICFLGVMIIAITPIGRRRRRRSLEPVMNNLDNHRTVPEDGA